MNDFSSFLQTKKSRNQGLQDFALIVTQKGEISNFLEDLDLPKNLVNFVSDQPQNALASGKSKIASWNLEDLDKNKMSGFWNLNEQSET